MGKYHAWKPEFNSHPLAACIDNHTACIDGAIGPRGRTHSTDAMDFLSALLCLRFMSDAINRYCDDHRIAGYTAAEYWLERFMWVADCVVPIEPPPSRKPKTHSFIYR